MPAGTIALTNNSTTVTGSGTSFTTELKANDFIVAIIGGVTYTLGVQSVNSATSVTLTTAYNGPNASGVAWTAVPNAALVGITAQVAADVAKAIRGLNMDKQNWQQIFSGTGNVTVTLPDGSQYSGPAWNSIVKRDGSIPMTGSLTAPAIELMSITPYIDFHYNNSSADFTARILHTEAQALEVTAGTGNISFRVNGGLRVGGAGYSGGINIYRGNGDENAVWGINANDGNLNIVRGGSTAVDLNFGGARLNNFLGLRGRQGTSGGTLGNPYNFYWTGAGLQAWVDTSMVGTITSGSTSDKGLKKGIKYRDDASKALTQVLQWRPADFKMKARGIVPESAEQLGFIANDLVQVSPECVSGSGLPDDFDIDSDPNNPDAYYLNQIPMIAKLTQAIQAQQKIIDSQAEIIKAMGIRLKDLDGLDG
ncbi:tail fiber domain-containing protein [Pantoea sp. JKS000250]|uniref:tail fiber domain-containing protein n=1 Tax=Pantoea sp. JKS000250 TaxID=1938795 RepID=UPI000D75143F|nr:tail fiber domain-containing protein [Pantoea sp. JKS000250]PXW18621.1 endosialidase-like protein [Pantoea sp. JKS000250]